MDSLGLGYQDMAKINPSVILCSISGYGQTGPYSQRSGHDINYMALSGALGLTGEAGGAPVPSAVQVADIGGGALMAVAGILSAYIARLRTGRGQYIDVSMLDGVVSWMTMLYAQQAAIESPMKRGEGVLNGGKVCYGVYETMDGLYMSLGALEPKFWQAFCEAVERPELIGKQFAHDPDVLAEVERIFKGRTQQDWASFFEDKDVCCEAVLESSKVPEHPQIKARGLFISLSRPQAETVGSVGNPLKFPAEKEFPDLAPPGYGEQTLEVLREAGFTGEEIERLERVNTRY